VPAQHYWDPIISNLALAEIYLRKATGEDENGEEVDASSDLERAEQYADTAGLASVQNVPDGWDDVSGDLAAASGDFKTALDRTRKYLDTQEPSIMVSALHDNEEAKQELEDATAAARRHYVDMGGQAADIASIHDKLTGE
jgi:hypothetical protein